MVSYPFQVQVISNQSYDAWVKKVMVVPGNSNKMLLVAVKKALDCLKIHSVTRVQGDMDFLVSRWSVESHAFVAVRGKFAPTLEDVLDIIDPSFIWRDQCDGLHACRRRQGQAATIDGGDIFYQVFICIMDLLFR